MNIGRFLGASVVAFALVLTGCTSTQSGAGSSLSSSSLADQSIGTSLSGDTQAPQSAGPFIESADGGAFETRAPDEASSRSIVQTGFVEIEVAALRAGVNDVASLASSLGGAVVSQQVSESGGADRAAYISIEVPAAKFAEAFEQFDEIGHVRSEQRSTDDVTNHHVDLQARVAALHTSVDRLTDMLGSATTTADLLDIENMLAERQAQLDGLEAQLQALEGQVSHSSIQVSLSEPSVLPGGGPTSFWGGIQAGVHSLGAFLASSAVVLGVALPWIVLAAILAALVTIPLRIRRKRQRQSRDTTDLVAKSAADE